MSEDKPYEMAKAVLAVAGVTPEQFARHEGLITGQVETRLLITTAAAQELTAIPPATWKRLIKADRKLLACRRLVGEKTVRWHLPSLQVWAAKLPKGKRFDDHEQEGTQE